MPNALIPKQTNHATFQVDSMDPADSPMDIALELGEEMELDTLQFIQLKETLKLVLGEANLGNGGSWELFEMGLVVGQV